MAKWCLHHHQESFLYYPLRRDLRDHAGVRVAFSLGDGLRPGSIADANDAASSPNWRPWASSPRSPGSTTSRCDEGPGHVPMQLIKENMDKQLAAVKAPFYTLGR
nr:phosphomethylpyrimidine synthase ThiC [Salinicola tamaricis]